MSHRFLVSPVLLAVSLSASEGLAEPTADVPPTAPVKIPYGSYDSERARSTWHASTRSTLREAAALEKEGKTEEALEKYRDAFRAEPYTDMYVELGMAEARAGLMLACARNLQVAVQRWSLHYTIVRPIESIREVFAYCKKDLGAIAIKANVPDTRVTIDGEYVVEWPYVNELYVEPGKHTVKAMKDGYWMNQTFVEVGPGEQKPLNIAMQLKYESHYVGFMRPVTVNFHANLATGAKDDPPTWPRNVIIASVVGMGLGVGALGLGLVQYNNAETKQAQNTWTGVASAGGVLLGLGVIGLGIGIASRPEPPPPNIIITPQMAKDGGGVQLTGLME